MQKILKAIFSVFFVCIISIFSMNAKISHDSNYAQTSVKYNISKKLNKNDVELDINEYVHYGYDLKEDNKFFYVTRDILNFFSVTMTLKKNGASSFMMIKNNSKGNLYYLNNLRENDLIQLKITTNQNHVWKDDKHPKYVIKTFPVDWGVQKELMERYDLINNGIFGLWITISIISILIFIMCVIAIIYILKIK